MGTDHHINRGDGLHVSNAGSTDRANPNFKRRDHIVDGGDGGSIGGADCGDVSYTDIESSHISDRVSNFDTEDANGRGDLGNLGGQSRNDRRQRHDSERCHDRHRGLKGAAVLHNGDEFSPRKGTGRRQFRNFL